MPLVTLNLTDHAHLVYRRLALTRSASETVSIFLESLDQQAKRRAERREEGLRVARAILKQFGDAAWSQYAVDGTIPAGLVIE